MKHSKLSLSLKFWSHSYFQIKFNCFHYIYIYFKEILVRAISSNITKQLQYMRQNFPKKTCIKQYQFNHTQKSLLS